MAEEQGQDGRYPAYRWTQDRDFPVSRPLPADDEISLFDLWEVLRRRRLTILLVFLVVVLSVAAYGLSREPVYAVTSFIEIGKVPEAEGEVGPIESPETVVARLENILIPAARESLLDPDENLPTIDVELANESGALIRLSAEIAQTRTDRMQSFLSAVNEDLVAQLQSQRADRLDWFSNRLANLQTRMEAMDVRGERTNEDMSSELPDNRSDFAEVLRDVVNLSLGREQQENRWELEDRLAALQSAATQIKPTEVPRGPSVSDDPVGTGANLIIALGAVLGLMLGVFAAFIREFLVNARKYREQPDADQS